jgi:FolB domain-containing protein
VDYSAVAAEIERIAVEGRFQLLETLATHVAERLLVPPVTAVNVEIQKPAALPATSKTGVSIRRQKTEDLP